ncbi:hypothetical protein SAMN04487916_11165 [Arthrobacter sp. ov407]|nr:hypothetical protein SAMN04487916_11165 [Arthrobacter sp. ov407]
MFQKEAKRPAGTAQSQTEGDRGDAEDGSCLRCVEVFEDHEAQCLLMDLREYAPRPAQVHAIHDWASVFVQICQSCGICEANTECHATLFASMSVQQNVPRDAEDPGSRVPMAARQLIEAAPHNQERVGNHVFGVVWVRATLNKSNEIWVDHFIQLSEGVLPVRSLRKVPHALYLSATRLSVSHAGS